MSQFNIRLIMRLGLVLCVSSAHANNGAVQSGIRPLPSDVAASGEVVGDRSTNARTGSCQLSATRGVYLRASSEPVEKWTRIELKDALKDSTCPARYLEDLELAYTKDDNKMAAAQAAEQEKSDRLEAATTIKRNDFMVHLLFAGLFVTEIELPTGQGEQNKTFYEVDVCNVRLRFEAKKGLQGPLKYKDYVALFPRGSTSAQRQEIGNMTHLLESYIDSLIKPGGTDLQNNPEYLAFLIKRSCDRASR